jgi:hypothetical protein
LLSRDAVLLCPQPDARKKNLPIMDDVNGAVVVDGLSEITVVDIDDILDLLDIGEKYRHFGATNMNEHSSRSVLPEGLHTYLHTQKS